jgi:type III secretion system low calcium response chaperone LcrH/SycD
MMQLTDHVAEFKAKAEALPAARRFDDADLETIYTLAYGIYQKGDYARALTHFRFLTLYRPTSVRYLKGLGASQFMAREYAAAAGTYSFLLLIHPRDAETLCMYGHAKLLLGERAEANQALEQAARLRHCRAEFVERAEALLELIAD